MSFSPAISFITLMTLLSLASLFIERSPPDSSLRPEAQIDSQAALLLTPKAPKVPKANSKNYSFNNPTAALHILRQLDPPATISVKHYEGYENWTGSSLMIRNDQYCNKAISYFIENPDFIFDKLNFLAFYRSTLLRNDVIEKIGNDMHPHYRYKKDQSKINTTMFEIDPRVSIFYIWNSLSPEWQINRDIACTHQLYNQVLDTNSIYFKTRLDQYYKDYSDYHKNDPQCLPSFMPESYLLDNNTQCKEFFSYMNSNRYTKEKSQVGVVFLRKIGVLMHAGKGVEVVDAAAENKLRETYKDGALCGEVKNNYQLQRYIGNPLLVYGHKFDLRVYMLIASADPLIVYYHDGNIRVSLHDYDSKSKDKAAHLTNTHLSMDIFDIVKKEGNWRGMNEEELLNFQSWNYTRLQNYLLSEGKISDKNWLENSLRYQMKKAMVHIVKMTKQNLFPRSNMFQMMGLDFLLDDNLKVWFIEANKKPGMDRYNDVDAAFQRKMLKDLFEVMYSYLRSRIKRVIKYVNQVSDEVEKEGGAEGMLLAGKMKEFEKRKMEFDRINRNYLEPEYQIPANNGFVKIMDEGITEKDRYAGLISEKC